MIYAFFKINDVQVRVISLDDLLNIEVVNDILKKFDQSWEETPVAGTRRKIFWKACTIDSCRSRLSCNIPWRYIIPIGFTEKSRKATRS